MFIPANGSTPTQLGSIPNSSLVRPVLSPDGSKVYYGASNTGAIEVHLVDVNKTEQMISIPKQGPDTQLTGWAPDSRGVVYRLDPLSGFGLDEQNGQTILLCDTPGFCTDLTWVDQTHLLFSTGTELRFRALGEPSVVIDNDLSRKDLSSWQFDFALVKP